MNRIGVVSIVGILALGACADDVKQDASQAPFDPAEEGKEDSSRHPSKGGDLRVGQLAQGAFDTTHGYIGYEIQLDAGTVDIDLTGTDGLDTILYVFGPKKANGKYPSAVLAFNDDYEPGVNLGSHIVLAVPQAGTYRIVVSTYDNWLAYPFHVTVAGYKLIVKCQDATWGACGPAVSEAGGVCWTDGDCLSHEGKPLHCEGEITCPPGTECLWVRQGTCVEDYAWMTIAPRQCANPWSDTMVSEEDAARFPSPELAQVVKYYAGFEIAFDEIGLLAAPEPPFVCLACACPRGDEIVIKVKTPVAAVLGESHGWTYSSAEPPALSVAPRQCGSNPWQSAPAADVWEELELVDAWTAGMGAGIVKRGFTWPVEPLAVCEACSCPRGDRLMAFPVDQEASGLLAAHGFADVYVP